MTRLPQFAFIFITSTRPFPHLTSECGQWSVEMLMSNIRVSIFGWRRRFLLLVLNDRVTVSLALLCVCMRAGVGGAPTSTRKWNRSEYTIIIMVTLGFKLGAGDCVPGGGGWKSPSDRLFTGKQSE